MVPIYNGILLSTERNETMSFAATWMDIEIIILNEVRQWRQTSYDITYMCNLKKNGYKWTYLQNKNRFRLWKQTMVTKVDKWGSELGCGIGIWTLRMFTCNVWPMGTYCITRKILPNILWWSIWEKNLKKVWICLCICITVSLCCTAEITTL